VTQRCPHVCPRLPSSHRRMFAIRYDHPTGEDRGTMEPGG
jgi:hypothetical protein